MDRRALLLLLAAVGSVVTQCSHSYRVCKSGKTHGMKSEECFNVSLRTIPDCLDSDVEVLDLSVNRIKKIFKKDMQRYTSLKLLYLSDNTIVQIEEDAFDSNTNLQVLDLSLNPFSRIPKGIFHLPSLRKLYLSASELLQIAEIVEEAKPITSPLEALDISMIDMKVLPDLGVMPHLLAYNVSNIKDGVRASVKNFAGLCNLKFLDVTKTPMIFNESCECVVLEKWLRQREVRFKSFNCNEEFRDDCPLTVSAEDLALYDKCQVAYNQVMLKAKLIKILVPIAVIILIAVCVAVYVVLKRKRRRLQTKTKTPSKADEQLFI